MGYFERYFDKVCKHVESFNAGFLLSLFFWIGGNVLYYKITTTEPSPYIDEIFHIKQCQQYCHGNFQYYDPKLTTPPGLYLITIVFLLPWKMFASLPCDVDYLRYYNFLLSFGMFLLMQRILTARMQMFSRRYTKGIWAAVNVCSLPVLYFYSFFYYTDVTSTLLVISTFHFYSIDRSNLAGLLGLLSVTVRQTNLVWFACFAMIKCCKNIENEVFENKLIKKMDRRKLSYIWVLIKECWTLVQRRSVLHFAKLVLKELYLVIVAGFIFIWLIMKNGSLVIGDKSAHTAVIHLPQLLYFSFFTAAFSFPLSIPPAFKMLKDFRKLYKFVFWTTLIMGIIVTVNTMAHLYLISDNRHYTFYIWKRIFEKPFGRYVMIPLYIVSLYCIVENTAHLDAYHKLGYLLATVMVLVPQKLLEFRYFIVPYVIYRIETIGLTKVWQLPIELLFNLSINIVTILFFTYLPFQWPDGSSQRFSW